MPEALGPSKSVIHELGDLPVTERLIVSDKFSIISLDLFNVFEDQTVKVGRHRFVTHKGITLKSTFCEKREARVFLMFLPDGEGGEMKFAYTACEGCNRNWY